MDLLGVVFLDFRVDHRDIDLVGLALDLSSVVLTHLLRVVSFLLSVIEGTDLRFVAPGAIAVNPFVLVRVI